MENYKIITKKLEDFLYTSVKSSGLEGVVLGLSGGVDSAVVAVIAHNVFKEKLHCIMMPSHYSSQSSIDDANVLCKKFNITPILSPIDSMLRVYEANNPDLSTLRMGNISSRLRMITLYDLSQKYSALVLGTSNKSELLLGYGTIYGDMASAINIVGDLYKSEIFELARHLGVPDVIVSKAPSADWYDSQSDEADLGFAYKEIDDVLWAVFEEGVGFDELKIRGFDEKLLGMVEKKMSSNLFKRSMPKIAPMGDRVLVW